MKTRSGDQIIEVEGEILAQTPKAWLIRDAFTGKEVWLPKSVGVIIDGAEKEGDLLFEVPQWWANSAEIL